MNHRDIQRAVRAGRIDRAVGDAPSLGHLARAHGTGWRKIMRRKKRRAEGESDRRGYNRRRRRRRMIMAWSLLLVVATVGVLVIAVWMWLLLGDHDGPDAGKQAAASEDQVRVVSRFKSPSEAAALDWVKRALEIRDPAKAGEFFHLGSADPAEVIEFLRDMGGLDGAITGYDWRGSMDANHLLIDGVTVNTMLEEKPRQRLALLVPDESGRWKIDFDAFARTVRPSWKELLAMRSGQGLVRVIIAPDNYYNGRFSDDKEWICYGMFSPDTDVNLFGYCRRDSAPAAAMRLMGLDEGPRRVTLMIRRNEGAGYRQFEIMRVLAEDWVVSTTPFDLHGK